MGRQRRSSLKKKLLGNLSLRSLTGGNHHNQNNHKNKNNSGFFEKSERDTTSEGNSCEPVPPPNSRRVSLRDVNNKFDGDNDVDILGTSFGSSVVPSHNLKDEEVMMLLYHELQMAMEQ